MKKQILIIMLLCLVGFTVACNDDSNEPKLIDKTDTGQPIETLVGTSWRLVGFFDFAKNELREVEPKPGEASYNELSYTLNFDSDSTVSGYTFINFVAGEYNIDYSLSVLEFTRFVTISFAGEARIDVELYVNAMNEVEKFFATEKELKLFYNDKRNYLLFSRRQ